MKRDREGNRQTGGGVHSWNSTLATVAKTTTAVAAAASHKPVMESYNKIQLMQTVDSEGS